MSTPSNATPQYIWEDSPRAIWNSFQPPKYYYPFFDVYPGFIVIALFTLIHIIMDKALYSKAKLYANKVVDLTEPKWIKSSKHSSQLTYNKLSRVPTRQFAKKMKKLELNSTQHQHELIAYQKQCVRFAKHISKYREASFKVVVFGFVYVYGLCIIFIDAKWFWDQQWMWSQGAPQDPGNDAVFNLNIYYALQIGYHGHRALYQWFEYKRHDFWVMFIHHWVAVLLLIGSKMIGYQQIGATLLLCNDNCDLLMPLGKLAEYGEYNTLHMICTLLFCILWIPLRIVLYFYKVIWSISVDGYSALRPYPVNWLCLLGVTIIYALQFIWTKSLLEMVWKKLHGAKGVVDPRSDDEKSSSDLKKNK